MRPATLLVCLCVLFAPLISAERKIEQETELVPAAAPQLPYSAYAVAKEPQPERTEKNLEDEAEIWLTPSFVEETEQKQPEPASYVEIVSSGLKKAKTVDKDTGIKEWWAKLKAQLGGGDSNSTETNQTETKPETKTEATPVPETKTEPKNETNEPNIVESAVHTVVGVVSNTTDSILGNNSTEEHNTSATARVAKFLELFALMRNDDANETANTTSEPASTPAAASEPAAQNTTEAPAATPAATEPAAASAPAENTTTIEPTTNTTSSSFLEEENEMFLALKIAQKRNVFDWLKRAKANFFDLFRSHKASAQVSGENGTNSTAGEPIANSTTPITTESAPANEPTKEAKEETPVVAPTTEPSNATVTANGTEPAQATAMLKRKITVVAKVQPVQSKK